MPLRRIAASDDWARKANELAAWLIGPARLSGDAVAERLKPAAEARLGAANARGDRAHSPAVRGIEMKDPVGLAVAHGAQDDALGLQRARQRVPPILTEVMRRMTVYTTDPCGYCRTAKALLAKRGIWNEPPTGLVFAALVAAAVGLGSGLVLLRTGGLTLLMLTLCTMALLEEAANLAHEYTGGFDGLDSLPIAPLFGVFEFNPLYPKTQYLYVLSVLFVCFVVVRTLVYSPFGQSLTGIRENTLRMHAVGAPVRGRLVLCYALSAGKIGRAHV